MQRTFYYVLHMGSLLVSVTNLLGSLFLNNIFCSYCWPLHKCSYSCWFCFYFFSFSFPVSPGVLVVATVVVSAFVFIVNLDMYRSYERIPVLLNEEYGLVVHSENNFTSSEIHNKNNMHNTTESYRITHTHIIQQLLVSLLCTKDYK